MRRKITIEPNGDYYFDVSKSALILIIRNASANVSLSGDSLSEIELSRSDIVNVESFRNKRMFFVNNNDYSVELEFQISDVRISIREQRMSIDNNSFVVDEIISPVVVSKINESVVVSKINEAVVVSKINEPVVVSKINEPVVVKGSVSIENELTLPPLVFPELQKVDVQSPVRVSSIENVVTVALEKEIVFPESLKTVVTNDVLKVEVINFPTIEKPEPEPEKATNGRNLFLNSSMMINTRKLSMSSVADGEYAQDRWRRSSDLMMRQPVRWGNFNPGSEYVLSCSHAESKIIISPLSGDWDNHDLDVPIGATFAKLEKGIVQSDHEVDDIVLDMKKCSMYFYKGRAFNSTSFSLSYLSISHLMNKIPYISVLYNPIFTIEAKGTSLFNSLIDETGFCLINRKSENLIAIGADFEVDAEIYNKKINEKEMKSRKYFYSDEKKTGVFSEDFSIYIPRTHDFWDLRGIKELEEKGGIFPFRNHEHD